MLKVSLIIHEDVVFSAVASVIDMFAAVNERSTLAGDEPPFRLELVSEKLKNIQLEVPAQFLCYVTMNEVDKTDLILVPSFRNDQHVILRKNEQTIRWIARMHTQGAEVASLCVGSFFLAEAKLLDGREATSHWMVTDLMQGLYPKVRVKSDKVITDQNGIYTSGGAFSSLKLILYLFEKFCGRETAIWASKRFSIDLENMSQSHFAVFSGQHQHQDEEVLKSQRYIEQHFGADISVDQVAALTNTGKRNFLRRFKAATNNTPMEYIQRVRIEAAKKGLEEDDRPVEDIMLDTGYKDIKTFRLIFKRITGLTPQEYRKKYARPLTTI